MGFWVDYVENNCLSYGKLGLFYLVGMKADLVDLEGLGEIDSSRFVDHILVSSLSGLNVGKVLDVIMSNVGILVDDGDDGGIVIEKGDEVRKFCC
jgi:hypothetical protein